MPHGSGGGEAEGGGGEGEGGGGEGGGEGGGGDGGGIGDCLGGGPFPQLPSRHDQRAVGTPPTYKDGLGVIVETGSAQQGRLWCREHTALGNRSAIETVELLIVANREEDVTWHDRARAAVARQVAALLEDLRRNVFKHRGSVDGGVLRRVSIGDRVEELADERDGKQQAGPARSVLCAVRLCLIELAAMCTRWGVAVRVAEIRQP